MSWLRGPARAVAIAHVVVLALACSKKSSTPADVPTPDVTGLAAVPVTAEAVITVDVARLGDSPIVARAIEQLLLREPELAARWQVMLSSCKLDLSKQVKHVTLALGRKTADAGSGPVVMVATGAIVEADLVACVRAMVGDGHGELTAKSVGGRTLYAAKDGNRTMFFAFGRADTVVLGANEAFVTEALGAGKKVLDDPDMKRWIGLADQQAPAWGAGRIDDQVRKGLVRVTNGAVTSGPVAIVVALDASAGATIELGAVMANAADANALESFGKQQLSLLGYAAQAKGLGAIVDKVAMSVEPPAMDIVRFKIALTLDEVNQLLSVLDGGGTPPQDAGP